MKSSSIIAGPIQQNKQTETSLVLKQLLYQSLITQTDMSSEMRRIRERVLFRFEFCLEIYFNMVLYVSLSPKLCVIRTLKLVVCSNKYPVITMLQCINFDTLSFLNRFKMGYLFQWKPTDIKLETLVYVFIKM